MVCWEKGFDVNSKHLYTLVSLEFSRIFSLFLSFFDLFLHTILFLVIVFCWSLIAGRHHLPPAPAFVNH